MCLRGTPSGRAEVKKKYKKNAIRGSNVNILLTSQAGHWSKKVSYRFLKDGLTTETLKETCKGA